MLFFVRFSFLQNGCGFGLSSPLSQELFIFCLNDLDRLLLKCIDFSLLSLGLLNNFLIQKVDLFDVKVMLKFEHDLHIVSFEFQKLLSLIVVNPKHFERLLLNLLLKVNIVIGGRHKRDSHLTRQDHVHHIHLLDHYSVNNKFLLEVFKKVECKLSFDISDYDGLLIFHEVSDTLLTFLLKKLF